MVKPAPSPVPSSDMAPTIHSGPPPTTEAQIWTLLSTIADPEIPVISITDLGIVRAVTVQDDTVRVALTPTYSGCPATSVITRAVEAALRDAGVKSSTIETQISPPWTTDWIPDAGRAKLLAYGIAPPSPSGGPDACPHCGSAHVTRVSQYGSTPCKAHWRCDDCLEPFDYFKCH